MSTLSATEQRHEEKEAARAENRRRHLLRQEQRIERDRRLREINDRALREKQAVWAWWRNLS